MAGTSSKVMGIAVVAGILLLIAGLSGVAAWEDIKDFVTDNVSDNNGIQMAFAIMILIASFGGVAVIVGGMLIGKDKVGPGKLLITLGVGLGLIGFIITLIVTIMGGSVVMGGFLSIGAIGLILSIVARVMAKKEIPSKSAKPEQSKTEGN